MKHYINCEDSLFEPTEPLATGLCIRYSTKVTSRALAGYGRVTSNLQGYIESPYFCKRTTQKSVTQCYIYIAYTTVHDTAGKNNSLQWFSPFQESVLLCLLNTQSYENHHNSLTTKDILNL